MYNGYADLVCRNVPGHGSEEELLGNDGGSAAAGKVPPERRGDGGSGRSPSPCVSCRMAKIGFDAFLGDGLGREYPIAEILNRTRLLDSHAPHDHLSLTPAKIILVGPGRCD